MATSLGSTLAKVEQGLGKGAAERFRKEIGANRSAFQEDDYDKVVAPIAMRFLNTLQIAGRTPQSMSMRLTHQPKAGSIETVQYVVDPWKTGGVEGIIDLAQILRLVF